MEDTELSTAKRSTRTVDTIENEWTGNASHAASAVPGGDSLVITRHEVLVPAQRSLERNTHGADQNENAAAFSNVVRRHQDRLFNVAFRLVESSEDAADVVQDAFVKAFVAGFSRKNAPSEGRAVVGRRMKAEGLGESRPLRLKLLDCP